MCHHAGSTRRAVAPPPGDLGPSRRRGSCKRGDTDVARVVAAGNKQREEANRKLDKILDAIKNSNGPLLWGP